MDYVNSKQFSENTFYNFKWKEKTNSRTVGKRAFECCFNLCEFGFIFQKTHFSRNIVENISFFKHPLLGFFTLSIWLTGLPIKDAPLHIDPNSVAFWVNPRSRNTPWVDNILGTLDGLVRVITTPGQIFELDHVTFKLIWRCRVFFPYSTLLQNLK